MLEDKYADIIPDEDIWEEEDIEKLLAENEQLINLDTDEEDLDKLSRKSIITNENNKKTNVVNILEDLINEENKEIISEVTTNVNNEIAQTIINNNEDIEEKIEDQILKDMSENEGKNSEEFEKVLKEYKKLIEELKNLNSQKNIDNTPIEELIKKIEETTQRAGVNLYSNDKFDELLSSFNLDFESRKDRDLNLQRILEEIRDDIEEGNEIQKERIKKEDVEREREKIKIDTSENDKVVDDIDKILPIEDSSNIENEEEKKDSKIKNFGGPLARALALFGAGDFELEGIADNFSELINVFSTDEKIQEQTKELLNKKKKKQNEAEENSQRMDEFLSEDEDITDELLNDSDDRRTSRPSLLTRFKNLFSFNNEVEDDIDSIISPINSNNENINVEEGENQEERENQENNGGFFRNLLSRFFRNSQDTQDTDQNIQEIQTINNEIEENSPNNEALNNIHNFITDAEDEREQERIVDEINRNMRLEESEDNAEKREERKSLLLQDLVKQIINAINGIDINVNNGGENFGSDFDFEGSDRNERRNQNRRQRRNQNRRGGKLRRLGRRIKAGLRRGRAGRIGRGIVRGGGTAIRAGGNVLTKIGTKIPLVGGLVAGGMSYLNDSQNPEMEEDRKIARAAGAGGGAVAGGVGGAALGATIGTFLLPGIGTIIGGALGGIGGSILGEKGGKALADKAMDSFENNEPLTNQITPETIQEISDEENETNSPIEINRGDVEQNTNQENNTISSENIIKQETKPEKDINIQVRENNRPIKLDDETIEKLGKTLGKNKEKVNQFPRIGQAAAPSMSDNDLFREAGADVLNSNNL